MHTIRIYNLIEPQLYRKFTDSGLPAHTGNINSPNVESGRLVAGRRGLQSKQIVSFMGHCCSLERSYSRENRI
jgi:hypothetical protein